RALLDLAALAVALPQEDGGGRVTVRDRFDVHGWSMQQNTAYYKRKTPLYMATHWTERNVILPKYQSLDQGWKREAPSSSCGVLTARRRSSGSCASTNSIRGRPLRSTPSASAGRNARSIPIVFAFGESEAS